MKHLRYFENLSDYEMVKDNLDLPNMAFVEENQKVYYAGDSSNEGGDSDEPDKPEVDYSKQYLTFEAIEDGLTASLSLNECEYCVDGDGNWKSLAADTATDVINSGQTLSFRGNLTPVSNQGIGTFTISKKCNFKGNCMSMLFGDDAANNYSLEGKDYAFYNLFYNCTNVVTVSSDFLPATTLPASCYDSMFRDCTSLITAPELPATILEYQCYYGMFRGCTSLTTAPELPATALANNCYKNMFMGCTSLTTTPDLPATKLRYHCYYAMFYGCSKLNYIKMLATDISADYCLNIWVYNVASSGTFVKNPAMTSLPTGYSGIPEGWTVKNAKI